MVFITIQRNEVLCLFLYIYLLTCKLESYVVSIFSTYVVSCQLSILHCSSESPLLLMSAKIGICFPIYRSYYCHTCQDPHFRCLQFVTLNLSRDPRFTVVRQCTTNKHFNKLSFLFQYLGGQQRVSSCCFGIPALPR